MIRNLVPLICLAAVFSGSFALSTQSVEAKTSRNNSRQDRNYFVPPPPPYAPSLVQLSPYTTSLVPSAMGMMYAQAVMPIAHDSVPGNPVHPNSKYTRKQGEMPQVQVVQANSDASHDPEVEKGILKQIDVIDSEISNKQKEIGELLNL